MYFIEFTYDWNDQWFENYQQTYSFYWAFWLIFFSILCWVLNLLMVYLTYANSEYFFIFLACFGVTVVTTVISSSSLCKNGCNDYLALLSSSVTLTGTNYFIATALTNIKGSNSYLIMSIDMMIGAVTILYLALKISQPEKLIAIQTVSVTEMKNFKDLEESKVDEGYTEGADEDYKLFQIVLGCYCFYIGMVLTNWE